MIVTAGGEPITEPDISWVQRKAAELDAWSIAQGYEVNERRVCLLLGEPEVDRLLARMMNQGASKDGTPDRELRSWFIMTYVRLWPETTDRELQLSCHQFILRCLERAGLFRRE